MVFEVDFSKLTPITGAVHGTTSTEVLEHASEMCFCQMQECKHFHLLLLRLGAMANVAVCNLHPFMSVP